MYVREHIVEVQQVSAWSFPGTTEKPVVNVKTVMDMTLDEYSKWRRTQASLGNAFDLPHLPTSKELGENAPIVTGLSGQEYICQPDGSFKPKEGAYIPVNASKKDLYEKAYWQFVKSTTFDEAQKWYDEMLSHIDETLEPAEDGSWVKDPVKLPAKIKKKTLSPGWWVPFYVCAVMLISTFLALLEHHVI
jgi:hypothetical protein